MNKYDMTTERKKGEVVQAALSLFKEKGFTDTSVKEIAALAHVSQVSIYNYFGSKEALVSECARLLIHDTLRQAEEILTMDLDFIDKLRRALALCTEKISLDVSSHFSQKALDDPKMVEHLTIDMNRVKADILRSYVEQGRQDGHIAASISTETIIEYMEAINIAGSKMRFDGDSSAKIEQIHHLFLYGIIGK